jgi:hypothetical protein
MESDTGDYMLDVDARFSGTVEYQSDAIDQLVPRRAAVLPDRGDLAGAGVRAHGRRDDRRRRRAPRRSEPLVVLVNISGHGLLDLGAYRSYAVGEIEPVTADEASLATSLAALEDFNHSIGEPAPTP